MRVLLSHRAETSAVEPLSPTTFKEIFHLLDPDYFVEPYKKIHRDLSPKVASIIGAQPIRSVFRDFIVAVQTTLTLRRETGLAFDLDDYASLLRCAQAVGDGETARYLWREMELDGMRPDASCCNHYLAALCWSKAFDPDLRQRLRLIPHNMKDRISRRPRSRPLQALVGQQGVKDEAMRVFDLMDKQGLLRDAETFSLSMIAMAREGDTPGIKSILKQAWNVNLDALLVSEEDTLEPVKEYANDSPLHPSPYTLFAVAHAFGTNNDIPTALRLIDYMSRQYAVAIPPDVWDHLLEWTFVLSTPRGKRRRIDDGATDGQLPQVSVHHLWETMTSPPYNIQPNMIMYHRYIKSLCRRRMPSTAHAQVKEALALYKRSIVDFRAAEGRYQKAARAQRRLGDGEEHTGGPDRLQREMEQARVVRSRDNLFVRRFVRYLLAVHPQRLGNLDWERRLVPNMVRDWPDLLPERVICHTTGGTLKFRVRQPSMDGSPYEQADDVDEPELVSMDDPEVGEMVKM